jgi:hypothetical protein
MVTDAITYYGKNILRPLEFNPTELDRDMVRYSRLKRNIGVAAKCHEVNNPVGRKNHNVIMVTLTYKADTWSAKHISAYTDHVRKWLDRRCGEKLRYIWVAELQKRGVIHYHVIYWLPKGITMPKADKQGWWPHGSTRTEKAVAPVKYVMKYASKLDSKEGYPDGARTYAVGGLDETSRKSRRWLNFPSFIKARASISDSWTRSVGGGWLEHATKKIWPSEWGLSLVTRAKLHIVRIHDHGRPMENVAGPFEWVRPLINPAQVCA